MGNYMILILLGVIILEWLLMDFIYKKQFKYCKEPVERCKQCGYYLCEKNERFEK